jgi:hypothetical protein
MSDLRIALRWQISLLFCPFKSAGLFVLSRFSKYKAAQIGRGICQTLKRSLAVAMRMTSVTYTTEISASAMAKSQNPPAMKRLMLWRDFE